MTDLITMDSAEAELLLGQMADRFLNPLPLYKEVGDWQTDVAQMRIQAEKLDPNLELWQPWSPTTLMERTKKGNAELGLLLDTGHLLNSIIPTVDADGVSIGTDVPYAEYLQQGTHRASERKINEHKHSNTFGFFAGTIPGEHDMPARPFIGWTLSDIDQAEEMTALFLMGEL